MSQNVSSALLRDELFVQTGVGRRSRRGLLQHNTRRKLHSSGEITPTTHVPNLSQNPSLLYIYGNLNRQPVKVDFACKQNTYRKEGGFYKHITVWRTRLKGIYL